MISCPEIADESRCRLDPETEPSFQPDADTPMFPQLADFFIALMASALLICAGRLVERRWPAEPSQSREALHFDLKYGFFNLLTSWLFAPFAGVIAVYIVNRAGGGFIHLRSDGWWFLISLAAYLLVKDTLEYFFHRAQHYFPVLWSMHSLHHSEEAMNVATGWRHFWLESALRVALLYPVVGIIFATPVAISNTAALLYTLNHTWAHLNIRRSMGRWTLWVMNPQYHRLHHSVESQHWNRNFADLFPIFDVIFGTACVPMRREFPATGLVPRDRPARVLDALVWPLRGADVASADNGPKSTTISLGESR